ncbi:MAG: hypothetical protein ABID84_06020 [Chloroflexota bacterium]
MGCFAILAIPSAGLSFFFSSWIVMIFWGIIADDVGVETIGYKGAMVVTLALWMAMAPLIAAMGRRRWR